MRISPYGRLVFGFVTLLILQLTSIGASGADNAAYFPPNYLTFQPPPIGATYTDSNFGTVIKRLSNALVTSNADSGGNLISITTEYSTVAAFNQDNSKILLAHQSYFAVYNGTGTFLANLPFEINTSSEPRWSRSDPNLIYYRFVNQLKQYNVATGAKLVVHTFNEYSSITGKGESDISYDGNHFVLAGDNRHIFVYELSTDSKGTAFDTGGRAFDSIYITPQNNVTITWIQSGTGRYNGIELFDRNMNFQRQVARAGGHMDVTTDVDGSEVLVWTNSNDPQPLAGCGNGFVKIKLATAQQTCLLSLDWSLAVHISGADNNGWIFAETYAPGDPLPQTSAWPAYTNEILQIKLDGTEVRRLLHHRSRPFNSYTWHPRVSVSRDGKRIIYDSNYGLQAILGYTSEYSDVYLATVADSMVPTTPPPTTSVPPEPVPSPTGGNTTTTTAPGAATRIEQHNSAVVYSTGWYTVNQAAFSGGSAVEAMDAGSRATFAFSGTAVRWLGLRDEYSGLARVYLDGQLHTTVDTFASPAQGQAVIWSASGLPATSHTLVIEVTGSRNASAIGSWVWIDALEVDSSGTSTGGGSTSPAPQIPPATSTHMEQDHTSLSYRGTWFPYGRATLSGGSATLAMDKDSQVSLTFSGSGVSWIGYRDAWSGIAAVYLDGKMVDRIDTYAPTDTPKAVIYNKSGLASGSHTLTIVVTGRKSAASEGAWVWVDALEVVP